MIIIQITIMLPRIYLSSIKDEYFGIVVPELEVSSFSISFNFVCLLFFQFCTVIAQKWPIGQSGQTNPKNTQMIIGLPLTVLKAGNGTLNCTLKVRNEILNE